MGWLCEECGDYGSEEWGDFWRNGVVMGGLVVMGGMEWLWEDLVVLGGLGWIWEDWGNYGRIFIIITSILIIIIIIITIIIIIVVIIILSIIIIYYFSFAKLL